MQRKRNIRVKPVDDEADQAPEEEKAVKVQAPKPSLLSFESDEVKTAQGGSRRARIRLPESLEQLPTTGTAPSTQRPAAGERDIIDMHDDFQLKVLMQENTARRGSGRCSRIHSALSLALALFRSMRK
jgi:hypothetical protein